MEDRSSKYGLEGASDSRDLFTQSGQEVRLRQVAFEEAGVSTVQFGVIFPNNFAPFACVAKIKWSDNGNTIVRQVDVVNGVMVSAQGRVLDITLTDTTPASFGPGKPTPGADTKYTVTYVASRRPRPCQSRPPTLYGGTGTLDPHAEPAPITSLTFDIPNDAGVISVAIGVQSTASPAVAPNLSVSFQDSAGNQWGGWTIVQGGPPVFGVVPPGATEMVVTNLDASHGDNLTVWWGIDG